MADAELSFRFSSNLAEEARQIRAGLAQVEADLRRSQQQMGRAIAPQDDVYMRGFLANLERQGRQAQARLSRLGESFGEAARTRMGGGEYVRPGTGETFRRQAMAESEKLRDLLGRQTAEFVQGLSPELAANPAVRRQINQGVQHVLNRLDTFYQTIGTELHEATSGRLRREFGTRGLGAAARYVPTDAVPAPPGSAEYLTARERYAPTYGPPSPDPRVVQGAARKISEDVAHTAVLTGQELLTQIKANMRRGATVDPAGARILAGNLAQDAAGTMYRVGKSGAVRPMVEGWRGGEEDPGVTAAEVLRADIERAEALRRETRRIVRDGIRETEATQKVIRAMEERAAAERANARFEARRRRVLQGVQTGDWRNISGNIYGRVDPRDSSRYLGYRDIGPSAMGRIVRPDEDPRLNRALQRQRPQGFLAGLLDPDRMGGAAFGRTGAGILRYTAAAAGIGVLAGAMRDTKNEAVDYRDSLTDLEVALGRGEKVTNEYVDSLERFSRLAGTNVGDALDAAARGVRAFGDAQTQTRGQLEEIGAETAEQANVLAVIAGKPLKDATGDLIAIRSSFGEQATTLAEVNEAIASAKRLGGDPNQIAQGLANGAVAFKEAGFDLRESAGIISVIQARLDQTGQATATRLSRVFQIARGGQAQATFQSLGIEGGSIEEQLRQLAELRAEGTLTADQLERVVKTIGGTANTREAIALLDNYTEVQENTTQSLLEGGAAADEYARKSDDLAGLFRKLAGDVANLQVNIVESGLLAPIGFFLEGLEPALRLLNGLLNILNEIPGVIRTPLILLGEFAGAIALINRFGGRFSGLNRLITPIGGARQAAGGGTFGPLPAPPRQAAGRVFTVNAAGVATETAAYAANTGAKTANANATRRVWVVDQAGIVTKQAATAATARDTAVTAANTREKLRNWAASQRQQISRTTGGIGGFMRSPLGIATGVLMVAPVVQSVIDSFRGLTDANNRAAETLDTLSGAGGSVEQLKDAVQALSETAAEAREASAGVTSGWARGVQTPFTDLFETETWSRLEGEGIGTYLGRLAGTAAPIGAVIPGADDPLRRAVAQEDASRILLDRAEALEEAMAALGGQAGVFGGAIESAEDLATGLEQLEANGASAITILDAINAAIGEMTGGTTAPGTILPGGGAVFANELAGSFMADIEEAFADASGMRGGGSWWRRDRGGQTFEALTARRESLQSELEEQQDVALRDRSEVVRDAAEQRVRDITEELEGVDAALADINNQVAERLRQVPELGDERAVAEYQERIVEMTTSYLERIGKAQGGTLTEAERGELAGLLVAGLEDLPADIRDAAVAAVLDSIENLTTQDYAGLDDETQRQIQQAFVKFAPQVGRFAELDNEGPRAAAQAQVDYLQGQIDMVRGVGKEPIESLIYAHKEAERELFNAVADEAAAARELARSLLPEGDEIGGFASEFEDISAEVQTARDRGDKAAEDRAQARLNQLGRQMGEARRERASAQSRAALPIGHEMAASDLRVQEAAAELERLGRERAVYDSEGNVTKQYSEALIEYNQAVYDDAQMRREAAQAESMATLDPRDEIGRARQELSYLQAELLLLEEGSAAYWAMYGDIQRLKVDIPRMERERALEAASAARAAATDPRDTVGDAYNAYVDAVAERDSLDPTDPNYRALRDRAQRQVAERRLAWQQSRRDEAAARRRVDNYPGSQVQSAADDIRDARDELNAARPGTVAYYEALAGLRAAEIAYADAVAQHRNTRRLLAGDISDPVFMANEELRAARDAVARARAQGAPGDVLDPLLMEERQAEMNAERVAFQERMRQAETNRELGRMSHASYLQYLESEANRLRAIKDRTYQQQQMLDEVERAMKAANDAMSGQWNLGDITVPTVYEVRRSMAAQQAGVTPDAASTAVVNNYVEINGADIAEVRNYITHLLGPAASSRTTVGPRR